MTWIDVITTAEFLLLCAIAYGVYRVKQAIEDMYSGLGQLLVQHREIAGKILFQLDSGAAVPAAIPRMPLHVEVQTIRESLSSFRLKWVELHAMDLARIEVEEFRKQEREAKTKDAPENGDT